MKKTQDTACPCGGQRGRAGKPLADCCGRYVGGEAVAPTAEELMRSRYCAYVLGAEHYLKASWHPSTRPADDVVDRDVKWLGLEVRAAREDGDKATVEFVARCRIGGRGQRLHEVSNFVREDGKWLYVDGSFPQG